MPRTVEHDYNQILNITFQSPRDIFQIMRDGRVQINGILAGGADDNFVHVAVGCVEQASAFGRRQNSDRSRRPGSAKVCALQGIDGDVDLGNFGAVRKFSAYFFADIQHGCLVALALTDDDGATHGD